MSGWWAFSNYPLTPNVVGPLTAASSCSELLPCDDNNDDREADDDDGDDDTKSNICDVWPLGWQLLIDMSPNWRTNNYHCNEERI